MLLKNRLAPVFERLRRQGLPLRLRLWDGAEVNLSPAPKVTIAFTAAASLRHLANPSLDNLGRAYVEGEIDVEGRLTDVIEVAAGLAAGNAKPRKGLAFFRRPARHDRQLDAEAIAYHYDLSNEFYRQWLDRGMVYSCAYFQDEADTLEQAQEQKIDHILRKLKVLPDNRLLDIGCGWGALIIRAAEKFGAQALGITLSRNQCELARERIAAAGLKGRCEVRIEDYRDVAGHFDRIASVGMFEHVGFKNLRTYFDRIRELLTDDGIALNHGITATDAEGEGGDFIRRYVFPHSELPPIGLTLREMLAAGLEPVDVENLRRHYALTLSHWAERFEATGERLKELVGEKRWRIWRVYLAGCAHGFAHNWVAVHQVLAVKTGAAPLPLTRDYIYHP